MGKYRRKPSPSFDAIQYRYKSLLDNNHEEVNEFLAGFKVKVITGINNNGSLTVQTLNGKIVATPDDWITRHKDQFRFGVCVPSSFKKLFEETPNEGE